MKSWSEAVADVRQDSRAACIALMKPSHIEISDPVPLTGVFGRVEKGISAATMVITMQDKGDEFCFVSEMAMVLALQARKEDDKHFWIRNPNTPNSVGKLVRDGYAKIHSSPVANQIKFTEKGLEALYDSPWRRSC